MSTLFNIIQIILSSLLVASILIQARGTGLGAGFGGSDMYYHTKRGMEKIIFIATIALSALFIGVGLLRVVKGI